MKNIGDFSFYCSYILLFLSTSTLKYPLANRHDKSLLDINAIFIEFVIHICMFENVKQTHIYQYFSRTLFFIQHRKYIIQIPNMKKKHEKRVKKLESCIFSNLTASPLVGKKHFL